MQSLLLRLGVPKSLATLLSGEMRDTAEMPPLMQLLMVCVCVYVVCACVRASAARSRAPEAHPSASRRTSLFAPVSG
jgi:hypothetical protein